MDPDDEKMKSSYLFVYYCIRTNSFLGKQSIHNSWH